MSQISQARVDFRKIIAGFESNEIRLANYQLVSSILEPESDSDLLDNIGSVTFEAMCYEFIMVFFFYGGSLRSLCLSKLLSDDSLINNRDTDTIKLNVERAIATKVTSMYVPVRIHFDPERMSLASENHY
jgi:hypothetical protein